jgi:phosphatidyl-myo-inositol dimannoside synthase
VSPAEERPLGLAAVSIANGGDGIAYLARLLVCACAELTGRDPRLVELDPARPGAVSVSERMRFASRLGAEQAWGPARGWIFNHVGIARTQCFVPRVVRRPYAVFVCGIEAWDPAIGPARKAALRGAVARVAISHYTAQRVSRVHPDIGPLCACPLGLLPDHPPDDSPDASLLARVRPESVAIVGRMSAGERYKGHDQLLECWGEVRTRVPGAQLVVVGRGDDLPRLRRRAAELGIADDVLFTDFVTDATLRALLARVAAFAMPSRSEGFGLVYLEAMRAGLPCIGSDEDAAGDIILDGKTGFLVAPHDRSGLAGAIACLLTDTSLRRSLGRAGERRFHEEFRFERFRDRFAHVLANSFGIAAPAASECHVCVG